MLARAGVGQHRYSLLNAMRRASMMPAYRLPAPCRERFCGRRGSGGYCRNWCNAWRRWSVFENEQSNDASTFDSANVLVLQVGYIFTEFEDNLNTPTVERRCRAVSPAVVSHGLEIMWYTTAVYAEVQVGY
ncbi:unnamed protein product [Ectocarpus fasciculatus]